MDWNTFVTTLTVSGFVSGAFVFLAKSLSKHFLSMDLERFKSGLKATNEKELERLRADLRIAAFQHETTFAKLHERRAEVISELYVKLVKVHEATIELVLPFPAENTLERKRHETATTEAAMEFSQYFNRHRIYFDQNLCTQLQNFDRDIQSALIAHLHPSDATVGKWVEPWECLEQKIPALRANIENRFRQLLGLKVSSFDNNEALTKSDSSL